MRRGGGIVDRVYFFEFAEARVRLVERQSMAAPPGAERAPPSLRAQSQKSRAFRRICRFGCDRGVDTCLAVLKRRKKPAGRIILRAAATLTAAGALTAGIDETLQLFSPGRAPQITDVLLDIAGFISGAAIAAAIAAAVIALKARRPAPPP